MGRWIFVGLIAAASCTGNGASGAPPAAPAGDDALGGGGTPSGAADAALCATLLPASLPSPITHACDGTGVPYAATTDAGGSHVALASAMDSPDGATITYRFVPVGGGPAEPASVSGRWGTLLPRPSGFYWLTQSRSAGEGSPVDVIAPDGSDLGPVRGLGPTIDARTTPDGGLVAETVQGFAGATPAIRQERVSATAAWLGPVDPRVGWIDAVNARGDLLLLRDRAAAIPSYRWADPDLEPLTGWFDAYPRSPVPPSWFPLPDGTLVALHGVGTYAFRDRVEGIWAPPAWLAYPARATLAAMPVSVRAGKGFAFDPREGACELEVLTADGASCGRLKLPISRCVVEVGLDGTVIAVEGTAAAGAGDGACGWSWWPGLLR